LSEVLIFDGIFECVGDGKLPNNGVEGLGTIFAR
jgi:hypothetical protein